ncbi:MAG: hypothetical protein HQ581_13870 [Planctomycetes bacterium]|nr:hypothetical protein [Planctomycetota bacterium]
MTEFKKTISEADMLAMLAAGKICPPPLEVVEAETEVRSNAQPDQARVDGLLTLGWKNRTFKFAVACKSLSYPKAIEYAAHEARRAAEDFDRNPLLIVPYLSKRWLLSLEARGISALDLCGNGVITIPDELLVFRSGEPNKYPRRGTIKNVYRRNSAIAARVFLLVPKYRSLRDLREEIDGRGGSITMATVSKVCGVLDNDLIIERFRERKSRSRSYRLLQPEKLLEQLAANYEPPNERARFVGKSPLLPDEMVNRLLAWQRDSAQRAVLTGSSSTGHYATMAREKKLTFYCSSVAQAREALGEEIQETTRFANLELIETEDDFPYFDARDRLSASPIQVYLELTQGDKREMQTAEQVRRLILRAPLT